MKRVGFIYEKICDIDNIRHAIWQASKGKREQVRVKKVIENMDFYARKIRYLLINKTYVPSPSIIKQIRDGANKKDRIIHKPNFFPDQIIQWALILQIEPIMMKGMYEYNCGNVPKRGTELGRKTIRKWLDNDRKNTKYCFQMDVKKFYPSIKGCLLKSKFKKRIKDKDCLWLIFTIIDEGLHIGFHSSQWFSIFFLQDFDHYIKQKLGVKYYIRYVDDLVLFGPNKKRLHAARKEMAKYLRGIGLDVKSNWQVYRVDIRAVDFLGFRFFRNKTVLRKRNALRIMRRIRKISKKYVLNFKDASAALSYWGWLKHSNSFYFYQTYVKPFVTIKRAKKVVSYHAKIRNNKKRGINNQQPTIERLQIN